MHCYKVSYEYIVSGNEKLFTVILLPGDSGKFPVVIIRTPYVTKYGNKPEEDIVSDYLAENEEWLKRGYAMVIQQCRGCGKSGGDFIPFVNEREDSINLQTWIRKQPFYNGELYLSGRSYTTTVHYVTAPFADDIKGAVFGVQDTKRYNACYCNGCFKKGLHGSWYANMYKAKSMLEKNYDSSSFEMLPLKDFSKTVFGESVADFDDMLKSPNPADLFWNTERGGNETRDVTDNVKFPVLFLTGFYDIYTGGIFDMWNNMSEQSKNKSALVVSPYDHTDFYDEVSIIFDNGRVQEQFGKNYEIDWFDYIRKKAEKSPFEQGKITYYRLFEDKWATDDFENTNKQMEISLGNGEVSYEYDPYDAPQFDYGLSRCFGGTGFMAEPNLRPDIITLYSDDFTEDVFVKGNMRSKLNVMSDCEDTCFYIRVSIVKEQGDYGLRDDITTLCYQLGDYTPGEFVDLHFEFDEHAFLIKKGEKLRIDIASAEAKHYVRHTNTKGLFSEQTSARIAHNTVNLKDSVLILPIE